MAATKSKSAKKPVSKAVQGPSEKSASRKKTAAKKAAVANPNKPKGQMLCRLGFSSLHTAFKKQ